MAAKRSVSKKRSVRKRGAVSRRSGLSAGRAAVLVKKAKKAYRKHPSPPRSWQEGGEEYLRVLGHF